MCFMDLPSCVAGLAGETSEENAELAGIVDSMADGWCTVLLANFKQKNEELKVSLLTIITVFNSQFYNNKSLHTKCLIYYQRYAKG